MLPAAAIWAQGVAEQHEGHQATVNASTVPVIRDLSQASRRRSARAACACR